MFSMLKFNKKKHEILCHLEAITLTIIYVLTTYPYGESERWKLVACYVMLTEINSIIGDIKCLSTALVVIMCVRMSGIRWVDCTVSYQNATATVFIL